MSHPTPETRRRGRPGHDRDAVLRCATDLFIRRGYDATSVGDVASALGVTKSAVYHHVASKEDLLAAALDEALDGLSSALDAAAAADEGADAGAHAPAHVGVHDRRLRAALAASVHVLAAHLPAVTLLLRVRGNSAVERAALERRRHIDERLADLVRAAVAEGSLRADLPAEVVARLLFGTVNSLVEWYRPDGPTTPDELAESVVALAFEGLEPR